jgi:hypothetical protein
VAKPAVGSQIIQTAQSLGRYAPFEMTTEKPIQLDFVDLAKTQTLSWAKSVNIKIHNIYTVIPFVITDKSLSVWLFFETDYLVNQYYQDGTVDKVKDHYLLSLQKMSYPFAYLQSVTFEVDSHENVEKNFEGSYFYRLR